ncbi:flagellar basal-body rod protein FlgF [Cytobacillus spongiae]|uniref:flagellar basal-body rod protein FlgF n=1 Tax=Cytobacillus spongiae TaxID=2901381 RepID=UPI001F2F7393|nr:flagellar basal-body rod protein FlgF [Cytobacillus spongiae]UII57416.1 flagellar basal-body rod protein FlgF [Cytobacillus spongiae]
MLRSMYSGISGMKNFQTKLDIIGNNIANVNTFGYKKGRVTFKDTMNQTISGASAAQDNRGGKNPMQVGLGTTLATIDTIHTQSSLQTTGRPLDLAISGDGYFIVSQGNAQFYTRAGNFYLDDNGSLVTGDGLKVQAYKFDATGNRTNTYGDVAVNVNAVLPSVTTNKMTFTDNLSSASTTGSVYTQQIEVIDKSGKPHKLDVNFKKVSATTWEAYINKDPNATPAPVADTTITFDGAGKFVSNTTSATVLADSNADTFTEYVFDVNGDSPGTTTDDLRINLDFTKLTQLSGPTSAFVNPDGNTEGALESFNIGALGEINGVYSNGLVITLGQLALAKFSNPSGLSKAGTNLFQESINSGTANISIPGEGRGSIAAGSLEMSNVDLSEEFTEMITAQRGFQANTRIITTSDEILQELVNLKR